MSDSRLHDILERLIAIEAGQTQLRIDVIERLDQLQTRVDSMADVVFVTHINGLVRYLRRLTARVDALEGN